MNKHTQKVMTVRAAIQLQSRVKAGGAHGRKGYDRNHTKREWKKEAC